MFWDIVSMYIRRGDSMLSSNLLSILMKFYVMYGFHNRN